MDTKLCYKCKAKKPCSDYWIDVSKKDGLYSICKECGAKDKRDATKRYYSRSSDRIKNHKREVYDSVNIATITKRFRKKVRYEILTHYSNSDPPICACCGEDHLEFLCIDHIDGGGTKHKKELRESGSGNIYAWLKKSNYPLGYRVLCHNCNMSLGFYGYCPHGGVENVQKD